MKNKPYNSQYFGWPDQPSSGLNVTNLLVYLNGNNAAEGENNIKYANSYPMNLTVKNWFAQDKFESLW